jgi:pyruvate formate lyase activating enzyme
LGNLSIDRTICQNCGKCSSVCPPRALSICGEKSKCVDEVLKEVLQDKVFYAENGGVTASGGEPLLYPDFFAELFSCLHRESIHTALDTSGAVAFEAFQKVLPETDLVLYDLKGMDSYFHTVNTGLDNKLILDNLRKVGEFGVPIEIRMPIVPGLNDSQEELEAAGEFLASIKSIEKVKLLAWHKSSDKYFSAGMTERMNVDIIPPGKREMQNAQMAISRKFPGEIIIP